MDVPLKPGQIKIANYGPRPAEIRAREVRVSLLGEAECARPPGLLFGSEDLSGAYDASWLTPTERARLVRTREEASSSS